MKPIGNFQPENPFFLAPMEAVNCTSFRILCKRRGASVVYTDMIDADVFVAYAKEHTIAQAVTKYLNPHDEDTPLVIQLGGPNIENLKFVIEHTHQYATWFDYNVGCPLGSMLGKKGGCYLMKHPDQLYKKMIPLVAQCQKFNLPFTVKLRSGWDEKSINAVELAIELEKLGVAAIGFHPRTRKQRAQGKADWQLARKLKEAISIPMILSGDVFTAYDAHLAFMHTKSDYIMCARGAKNNPSIFAQLVGYWRTKTPPLRPMAQYVKTSASVRDDFLEFADLYESIEQRNNIGELIDHASWYIRGCRNNTELTPLLRAAKTLDEIKILVEKVRF